MMCVCVCACASRTEYLYTTHSQGIDDRGNHTGPVVTVLLLRVIEGEQNSLFCGDPLLTTFTHAVGWLIHSIQQDMYSISSFSLMSVTKCHY